MAEVDEHAGVHGPGSLADESQNKAHHQEMGKGDGAQVERREEQGGDDDGFAGIQNAAETAGDDSAERELLEDGGLNSGGEEGEPRGIAGFEVGIAVTSIRERHHE